MTREITDLIDNAIQDWQTSDDAMRWAPEPIEPARDQSKRALGTTGVSRGALECLFVGGPWHGQHHLAHVGPSGRLPEAFRVLIPQALTWPFDDIDPRFTPMPPACVYTLRRTAGTPVYCAPGATNIDVSRAVDGIPALGCATI